MQMEKYDHKAVEQKWQKQWEEAQAFRAEDDSPKKKLYVLDMFPYPSGSGLHVGHVEGYTATDIYSRYKRMSGYNILHPIGWDAFGLPAENYAVKTGVPPAKTTAVAIENFRRQIKSLGISYDWSREVGTHTPEYYKWTQWFFLFLYKQGLAEKKTAKVNWDPVDQPVLANEQVLPDGTAERSGAKVVQKELEQWCFKITDFADALVDDLDKVDWPESTKINQRNWIGRSEGALIKFKIYRSDASIEVFTTRPDTLFGATYLVLAPEPPLLRQGFAGQALENQKEVDAYIATAKNKTDLERQEEVKEKTGVELKGVKAINPATNEEIPIYVADYVLGGYGTGAIMAVPAHDERDLEFAKKFKLPIVDRPLVDGKEITQKVGGRMVKMYKLRDWLISRQRYWGAPIPIVYDPEGKAHPIPEEHLPWLLPTDVDWFSAVGGSASGGKPTGISPLSQSKELLGRTERIFGKGWRPEVDTMDTFVCSSWYYFRFADPHNDKEFASAEKIKQWLPVDLYVGGAEHTVLHLLYARFFAKALHRFGIVDFNEPFLKLRHQGIVLAEDGRKMSKRWNNVINPDDVVAEYGADTTRLYEMFMGPLEQMKPWNSKNIVGVRRFLDRVWRLEPGAEGGASMDATIKKVTEDIEALKFNTSISELMIALNKFEKSNPARAAYEIFLQLLAPFAPHITEELWQRLGREYSIHASPWPSYDPAKLAQAVVVIAVQVNGKVRGSIELAASTTEEEALIAARSAVGKWLTGPEKKAVYVPGRIVSFQV